MQFNMQGNFCIHVYYVCIHSYVHSPMHTMVNIILHIRSYILTNRDRLLYLFFLLALPAKVCSMQLCVCITSKLR